MLQNKFGLPLDLAVKPSKIFYTYLVIIFLLSLSSILVSNSLPASLRFMLFFLLLFTTGLIFKKQTLNKVTSLKLSNADKWELEINNKQRFEVELNGECIVTYFLVWLNFTTFNTTGKKKIFHILLLPDSTDRDLLRQLRVRLRFLKDISAASSPDEM